MRGGIIIETYLKNELSDIDKVQMATQLITLIKSVNTMEWIYPERVMRSEEGQVYLEFIEGGCPYEWMAPEIYHKKPYEQDKVYQYMIGLLLYYLFNEKRHPFQNKQSHRGIQVALQRRYQGEPVPLLQRPELDKVLQTALAYNAANRYCNLAAMHAALSNLTEGDLQIQEFLDDKADESDVTEVVDSDLEIAEQEDEIPERVKRRFSKHMVLVPVTSLVVVGIIAVLVTGYIKESPDESKEVVKESILPEYQDNENYLSLTDRKLLSGTIENDFFKVTSEVIEPEIFVPEESEPENIKPDKSEVKETKETIPEVIEPESSAQEESGSENVKPDEPATEEITLGAQAPEQNEMMESKEAVSAITHGDTSFLTNAQRNAILGSIRNYVSSINSKLKYTDTLVIKSSDSVSYTISNINDTAEIANYLCIKLSPKKMESSQYSRYGISLKTEISGTKKIRISCTIFYQ